MKIWKKRARDLSGAGRAPARSLLICLVTLSAGAGAEIANRFECLKTLLPLTKDRADVIRPDGTEPPFMINENYLAFAAAEKGRVAGFYVYDHDQAWYYDTVERPGGAPGRTPLKALRADRDSGVIELTAQPNGLETIAISHLPGFGPNFLAVEATYANTAILGASVLPVVGAFIPHPKGRDLAYHDPRRVKPRDLETWFTRQGLVATERTSTSDHEGSIARTILKLAVGTAKTPRELWAPLDREIERRRAWVKQNNIDLVTFGGLNKAMQNGCRQKSEPNSQSVRN